MRTALLLMACAMWTREGRESHDVAATQFAGMLLLAVLASFGVDVWGWFH